MVYSRNFKDQLIFHVSLTIVIIDSRFWRTFPRSLQVVDTAPDDVYEKLAARLFFSPLEAVLWYVPSYQLTDVSDLFWAMKLRSRQIFGRSINEGKFEYSLENVRDKDFRGNLIFVGTQDSGNLFFKANSASESSGFYLLIKWGLKIRNSRLFLTPNFF